MAFPRKLLNEGEDIILDLRPHWWVFTSPVVAVVVALVALGLVVAKVHGGRAETAGRVAAVVLLVAAVVWLVARFARWTTTEFVVTTDRLITRRGILSKSGREIPLERVNDISFHSGLFERIVGAGDLVIESAGERGQDAFTGLPHPARVQNTIYREIERSKARDADRMAGRRELSVPEQLEKLDELRQRGILSQAEFDAKKAQLLDRL